MLETSKDCLIPKLSLTTKLKALTKVDHRVPIMTAFVPAIYQGYENNDYVDLPKLVNPILEQERFINIKAIHSKQGFLYFFTTNDPVVAHIKENNYVFKHVIVQTIFNRNIEFGADSDVFSGEKSANPSSPLIRDQMCKVQFP
jgi:hypothetical protein